jgi:Leucine-rich repeat (LRR) protein
MFFKNIYEVTIAIGTFYTEISTHCGKLSLSEIKNDQVDLFIKRFFRYCIFKKTTSIAFLLDFVPKLLKSATDLKLQFIITYMANSPLAVFYREYSHNPKFQKPNIIHIFSLQPPLFSLFSLIGITNETITSALFSEEGYLTRLYKEILNNDRLKPSFKPYFEEYQKEETESSIAHKKRVTRYFIEDYFPEVLQGAYYPKNVYEVENRVNPIATASDVAAVFRTLIEYINNNPSVKKSRFTYEKGVSVKDGEVGFDHTITPAQANMILERFIKSHQEKLREFGDLTLQGVKLNTLPTATLNLKKIKTMLIENSIGFNLPFFLGEMESLQKLTLIKNKLRGRIPLSVCNLPNLTHLNLSENALAGEIPTELGKLNNLERLILSNNAFTGNIPTELGKLSNLERLILSNNALTGNIPTELGELPRIHYLDLAENALTGNIPTELGNLEHCESFYFDDNKLTGPLPRELITSELADFGVRNNRLTGTVHEDFFDFLTKGHFLDLEENLFTGEVPVYDPKYEF